MPTTFTTTMANGDVIETSHVAQYASPINNIETGAAFHAHDTGGDDAYAVSLSSGPTAYTAGMMINLLVDTANSGPATLNVNSLGAKSIKREVNQDLVTGDIVAGQLVQLIYDGTNFQLMGQRSLTATENVFQTSATGTPLASPLALRNSQAPGASGDGVQLRLLGHDGSSGSLELATIQATLTTATAGSTNSRLDFSTVGAGSNVVRMAINNSSGITTILPLMVGGPSITTTPGARLHVQTASGALGSEVLRIEGVSGGGSETNDDPALKYFQGSLVTTNATPSTLLSVPTTASKAMLLEAYVVARRTNDDVAAYVVRGLFKNVGGTVTQIGVTQSVIGESDANWDATLAISGTNIIAQVTGVASSSIAWHGTVMVSEVGT